jgi:hypothetical protein
MPLSSCIGMSSGGAANAHGNKASRPRAYREGKPAWAGVSTFADGEEQAMKDAREIKRREIYG